MRGELRGLFGKQQSRASAAVGAPPCSSPKFKAHGESGHENTLGSSGFAPVQHDVQGNAGSDFFYTFSLLPLNGVFR